MLLLLLCLIVVSLILLISVREGFSINYDGNAYINLPTRTGTKVNYNFSSFGANGVVEGAVKLIPTIPPPRTNHYRYWVWDVYYYDKDGVLYSSGHWNYFNTYDYDYNYYGPNGDSNYHRYFY
jgi:hypothetical protein